jgi:hypothetical protein
MADYTSIHTGLEVDSAVTSMQLLTGGAGLNADILITNNKFFKGETGFGSLPTNLIGMGASDRITVGSGGFLTDMLGTVNIAGNLLIPTPTVPASAVDAGTPGTISWEPGFVYVCIANASWQRGVIAAW